METRERCEAYLDDELDGEEGRAFAAWLHEDAQHMKEFARWAYLHRSLRSELKGRSERHAHGGKMSGTPIQAARARVAPWKKWSIAAAIFFMAGFAIYYFVVPDPALAFFSARVEKLSGTAFKTDQLRLTRIPAKEKDLLNEKTAIEFDGGGSAVLRYFDDTTLDFTASSNNPGAVRLMRAEDRPHLNPSRVGKRLTIENGVLWATVSKQPDGKPLIISTSQAEVTVVGTRFRLAVDADATRLDVVEGKVRIVRYADEASADVSAGEFVIVNAKDALLVKRGEVPK